MTRQAQFDDDDDDLMMLQEDEERGFLEDEKPKIVILWDLLKVSEAKSPLQDLAAEMRSRA